MTSTLPGKEPYYTKTDNPEVVALATEYIELINQRSGQTALRPSEPKFFICPVGVLGSGKSTVLKQLERELTFVRVSGDEIRELLYQRDGDQRIAWQVGAHVVEHYVKLSLNVAHDTDCATPATIKNVTQLAKTFGYQIYWIHITTPPEFIENKLRNYPHTYLFSDAGEAITRLHERIVFHKDLPPLPFIGAVDASSSDLGEHVKVLAAKILKDIKRK